NAGNNRLLFGLWILAQLGYFAYSYYVLINTAALSFFSSVIGQGLPIARASANIINLNCALILFTVCRNLISALRTTMLNRFVLLDSHIAFHVAIAWAIVFWGYVHAVAHYVNYLNVEHALLAQGVTAKSLAFDSGPGITGQVVTVALFLMVTSAVAVVRRKHFEMFWFTHHLYIVFFAGLLMHGAFCFIKSDGSGDGVGRCRGGPQFWKWWIFSGGAFLIEKLIRECRGRQQTHISKVIQHPSRVVEIQIKKPSITTKAGQYILISCPSIALHEWHPFTLTSSPHEKFISIHIRVVGDWTTRFAQRLGCSFPGDKDAEEGGRPAWTGTMPVVLVDGPYGSASEDVFDYEVAVLVGAGIGVTPFGKFC
ncbi:FAD-binding domain-containing protein, partial [Blyttiomyces helicus]